MVTTCAGAGNPVFKGVKFPRVIIDEATQSTEVSTLIPLGRQCQELVLIGDSKQLPPVVLSEREKGLEKTLFDRLRPNEEEFLNDQRRMHPDIVKFPSEQFYGGTLNTVVEGDKDSARKKNLMNVDFGQRVNFVEVDGSVERTTEGNFSKVNSEEAEMICEYLENTPTDLQVAVCCFYSAQRDLTAKKMKNAKNLKIVTVDGFQGGEADVVLISTVRTKNLGGVYFGGCCSLWVFYFGSR